jgi:predicted enzyme related to lactoylglutathione lyase
VVAEPFDVLDVGRMAAIQDPTGAAVFLWEPRESIGADLVNGPGLLSLTQLNTTDPDRAGEFYTALLGWRMDQASGTDTPYWGYYVGERLNAGMMQLSPDAGAPSHWLVYFGSEGVDADAERIPELGGRVPGGSVLVAQDPQGAAFALFAGRFDE